ncbi:MAG: hypothetical protein H6607_02715 [Flavobacteriales bacterium]|nr:hypothetical protein [Flavobacteriales bacterium]
MKKLAIICIALFIAQTFMGCNKVEVEKGTPKSVEERIKIFSKSTDCNDAKAEEFSFQGSAVYTLNPGTCGADMSTEVLDSDANVLGLLGGFVGNSKINGVDFSSATFVRTVWTK